MAGILGIEPSACGLTVRHSRPENTMPKFKAALFTAVNLGISPSDAHGANGFNHPCLLNQVLGSALLGFRQNSRPCFL